MRHLRRLVKTSTDAVSHELPDDRATFAFRILLNNRANIAQARPLAHLRDPELERSPRNLRHVTSLLRRLPNVKSGRGVAEKALVKVRHVDVDDVSFAEPLAARNAV